MLLLCYIKNVTLQISGVQLSQLHQPSKSQGVHLSQVHQPSNQCTNVLYDVVVLTYVTLLIISP